MKSYSIVIPDDYNVEHIIYLNTDETYSVLPEPFVDERYCICYERLNIREIEYNIICYDRWQDKTVLKRGRSLLIKKKLFNELDIE